MKTVKPLIKILWLAIVVLAAVVLIIAVRRPLAENGTRITLLVLVGVFAAPVGVLAWTLPRDWGLGTLGLLLKFLPAAVCFLTVIIGYFAATAANPMTRPLYAVSGAVICLQGCFNIARPLVSFGEWLFS